MNSSGENTAIMDPVDLHRSQLEACYQKFEVGTQAFKTEAACVKGCAFCCSAAGSIDATTQEGLVIQGFIEQKPKPQRRSMEKAVGKEIRQREKGKVVACPFLQKNKACSIYPVRPFSCRRVYSLHRCTSEAPPQLHRRVMEVADQTIDDLRVLDPNGYSGHLSYVLHMLSQERFITTYLAGDFAPEAVMAFGKTHRISINRMAPSLEGSARPRREDK